MLRWRHEEWGCTSHKKHVSWAESSYHGELLAHIGGTLIVRKPFRFVPWTSQKLHSTIVEDYWSGLLLGLFVGQIIAQSRKAHLCPTGHVEVPRIEWELVEMQIENFTYEGSWMFYSKTFLLQQNYQLVTPEIKCINKIKQKNMESIGTGSGSLKILKTYGLERSSTCLPPVWGSLKRSLSKRFWKYYVYCHLDLSSLCKTSPRWGFHWSQSWLIRVIQGRSNLCYHYTPSRIAMSETFR